jgi:hypothetical protein
MFGSKSLLFAYARGVLGLSPATGAFAGTLELPRLLLCMVGLLLLWTSALFGPLLYLWETNRTRASGATEASPPGERRGGAAEPGAAPDRRGM